MRELHEITNINSCSLAVFGDVQTRASESSRDREAEEGAAADVADLNRLTEGGRVVEAGDRR